MRLSKLWRPSLRERSQKRRRTTRGLLVRRLDRLRTKLRRNIKSKAHLSRRLPGLPIRNKIRTKKRRKKEMI